MDLYQYHNNPTQLLQEINRRKQSIEIPKYIPKNDVELLDIYQTCRVLDFYYLDKKLYR